MSNFTKGPWKYDYDNADWSGGGCWYSVTDKDGNSLLSFSYNSPQSVGDEKRANARLMSAAPELYEALEAVIAISDRATDVYDRAKAVLAKAKGYQ